MAFLLQSLYQVHTKKIELVVGLVKPHDVVLVFVVVINFFVIMVLITKPRTIPRNDRANVFAHYVITWTQFSITASNNHFGRSFLLRRTN